jgi:hypothetical protein
MDVREAATAGSGPSVGVSCVDYHAHGNVVETEFSGKSRRYCTTDQVAGRLKNLSCTGETYTTTPVYHILRLLN